MDRLNAEEYWSIFFTFGGFITFVSINAFVASTLPDLLPYELISFVFSSAFQDIFS